MPVVVMGDIQGFHKMGLGEEQVVGTPVYKQRKWRVCCGVCLGILLVLGVVAIALSQTVFKFRDPEVGLRNVKLQSVSLDVDLASLATLVSISVSAEVQVDNPNYYDFRYSNSTMLLVYHGDQVGVVELGAGTIRSRRTVRLPAVVTVEALRLLVNGLQDVAGGVASLSLKAVISGRVNLAHIYKRHVTAILHCNVDIFIGNRTLEQNQCKQTVKL